MLAATLTQSGMACPQSQLLRAVITFSLGGMAYTLTWLSCMTVGDVAWFSLMYPQT